MFWKSVSCQMVVFYRGNGGSAGSISARVVQVSQGLQNGEVNSECLESSKVNASFVIYLQRPVPAFTIRL